MSPSNTTVVPLGTWHKQLQRSPAPQGPRREEQPGGPRLEAGREPPMPLCIPQPSLRASPCRSHASTLLRAPLLPSLPALRSSTHKPRGPPNPLPPRRGHRLPPALGAGPPFPSGTPPHPGCLVPCTFLCPQVPPSPPCPGQRPCLCRWWPAGVRAPAGTGGQRAPAGRDQQGPAGTGGQAATGSEWEATSREQVPTGREQARDRQGGSGY